MIKQLQCNTSPSICHRHTSTQHNNENGNSLKSLRREDAALRLCFSVQMIIMRINKLIIVSKLYFVFMTEPCS